MPYKLLLTLICLFFITNIQAQDNSSVKIRRVVIDAGHGGHDPGAISLNRKVYEKNITLSVALKLGALIKEKYPDIDVIYTRKTDVFIPLIERTSIANRNKADLFISIHVNSAKAVSASGTETFVMGMDKSSSNLEVTMLENSVIALEGDSNSKYEGFDPKNPESYIIFSLLQNAHLEQSLIMASLIQNQLAKGPIQPNRGIKQGGLLVLWKTTMPAVLVEMGFISNSSDFPILASRENHSQFASSMLNAFEKFKIQYEGGIKTEPPLYATNAEPEKQDTIPDVQYIKEKQEQPVLQENAGNDTTHFTIQILAVNKVLPANAPDLKGEKSVNHIKVGKYYKYSIGKYSTQEEAVGGLRQVRKKFPGAFIIKVENGTIVPL